MTTAFPMWHSCLYATHNPDNTSNNQSENNNMKQVSKKKGFSLIELIVVIAVIAAIAAVIVPQFSNISGAAKNSADQRNVQLWNEVYANAYAVIGTETGNANNITMVNWPAANSTSATVTNIDVSYLAGGTGGSAMNFNAPGFTLVGSQANKYGFTIGKGITKNVSTN